MKGIKKFFGIVYFLVFSMLLTAQPTSAAYIDPATTSYLLQIVAGVFIAIGATVAVFWRKITFWFKKQKALKAKKRREKDA